MAVETVPLHAALEPFALRRADHVHVLAVLEDVHGDHLAEFDLLGADGSDFADEPLRLRLGRARVAGFRLRRALAPAVVEAELDRVVAVRGFALDLHHMARPGLDDGDGQQRAVFREELRHPDFFPQQPGDHGCCSCKGQALIRISTPAGISSRPNASIVLAVGSMMSMMRLWVRISNCSRDFLSMCGERSTV